VDWLNAKEKIDKRQLPDVTATFALLICGSARNDGTCREKSQKLPEWCNGPKKNFSEGITTDVLDLSFSRRATSWRFTCKAVRSTAMPLCHWPCTNYILTTRWPNRRLVWI
jgi:hypothetical protein